MIDEFASLSKEEQCKEIKKLGNRLYMELRRLRPLKVRFTKLKNYYEAKHFGWKWEE
jgi:hypothetical protein